jgi:transposase
MRLRGLMHAGWVADELVSDVLWAKVEPLLPARARRSRNPGRLPLDDRRALAGIVYVLKTGVSWREVPREVAGCSGVTCWRRLRDWSEAGVWPALHRVLLDESRGEGPLELDAMMVDASRVRALKGGPRRAPRPSIGLGRVRSTT